MESSSVQQEEITRELKTNLVTVNTINNPRYRQQFKYSELKPSADQAGAKTKKMFLQTSVQCRSQVVTVKIAD
ncbi:hypothetical protein QE152_g1826 [Popillia japonica]|uniref:Uncharacterized protein n=1 Tax=Popillia japonica TaxID=7064 RepID=A0AAW1N0V8_POPJA